METKFIILILVLTGVILLVARQHNVSAQQMTLCQDYSFNVNVNTAPVVVDFYIGNKLFKTVPSTSKEIRTLLHCGHAYTVYYSAPGYLDYTESYEVKSSMPKVQEVREINLIPAGGTE